MMGNPCEANWPGFKNYVIARLPQLQFLDGEAITRSMQIIAKQLPKLAVVTISAQEKRERRPKAFVDYRDIDTTKKPPIRRRYGMRRLAMAFDPRYAVESRRSSRAAPSTHGSHRCA